MRRLKVSQRPGNQEHGCVLHMNAILQNTWSALLVAVFSLLLMAEFGFRIGARRSPEKRKNHQSQSSSLQGALLGLLGLLLGFTFAMSVNRFDARKQLVLDESNGIGTAWLRAAFLSDPVRDKMRATMEDYVDSRLKGAEAPVGSPAFEQQVERSLQDQQSMWSLTVAELKASNTPATALFAASLNDVIDLDSKRQVAARNHVPPSVWLLLWLVSCTACCITGYTTGLGESGRYLLPMVILPLLLSLVIAIIADLDNPQSGIIRVSQQSMRDLQQELQRY